MAAGAQRAPGHPSSHADDALRALPRSSPGCIAAHDGRCVPSLRRSVGPSRARGSAAPDCSHGGVADGVALDHKRMAVRPLGRDMVAPGAPPGPWVSWGRLRAVGCFWMRVGCSEWSRVWAVPIEGRSLSLPREQLWRGSNRQNFGQKVLDFIKLSYMNMWWAWGRVRVRLTTRAVGLKSSLVEGHVPRKLIGYPCERGESKNIHTYTV